MSTPPNEPGTPDDKNPGTPGKDDESINLSKPDSEAPVAETPPPPDPTQFNPAAAPYPPGGAYPPYPQGAPPSYPPGPYPQQFGPGGQQYPQYPGGYGPPPQRTGSQIFSIIGFICAAIALLLCPLIGLAGIVLGIVGNSKGEPLGKWAAIAAGVCMVIGFGIGLAVYGSGMMNNN
ncbi:hypothetical protein [Nocardia concava]|uniref:hypothetical protein n=1 Tax=Nocardia concava TaxID=257281 RepID=UPI0002D370B4|nr:hypothetical protein [Nocardia concava]